MKFIPIKKKLVINVHLIISVICIFSIFQIEEVKSQQYYAADSISKYFLKRHVEMHNGINSGFVKFEKRLSNASFNKGRNFTDTIDFYFYKMSDSTIYYWMRGHDFNFGNFSKGSFSVNPSKQKIIVKPILKFPNLYYHGVLRDLLGFRPIVINDSSLRYSFGDRDKWYFQYDKDTVKSNLLITNMKTTYTYIDTILWVFDAKLSMNEVEQWDSENILELSLNSLSLETFEQMMNRLIYDSLKSYTLEYTMGLNPTRVNLDSIIRIKDIDVKNSKGEQYEFKNCSKIVLIFGFNGCAPCKAWKKQIEDLDTSILTGIDILYINPIDSWEVIENEKNEMKNNLRIFKADLSYCQEVFAVFSYPSTVIIDNIGKITNVINGFSNLSTMDSFLNAIK